MSESPAPLRVRRFRPRDIDAVMAIENSSFQTQSWPQELILEYFDEAPQGFLVAESAGKITGYAIACRRGARAELVSIAVRPGRRRSGAGKALLRSVISRLRRAGTVRLVLTVKVTNRAAIRFYESFGFTHVRRTRAYYEDGADGFIMARDL